jgi:beta-glucosidase-like glycosyl hydrolase
MTLRPDQGPERGLGECLMPRLQIEDYTTDAAYAATMDRLTAQQMVGGFCVFGGTPETVSEAVTRLQDIRKANGGRALIFSADCEFGLPMRLTRGGTEFPEAMAIARTGDPHIAEAVGEAIGREMRTLGLTWNFAPVVDVNSNPANPIINTRSFGEEASSVIRYAIPFFRGSECARVATSATHFPGNGDTSTDSHKELPFVRGGWERFSTVELAPFQAMIDAGVPSVMPGHLAAPELARWLGADETTCDLPATLSPILLKTLLREKLGFEGVIVTDALEMHAITRGFGADEAVVRAFEAGVDILLLPVDAEAAFDALTKAYKSGRITQADIQERTERIGKLREWIGESTVNPAMLAELAPVHEALATEVARRAIETQGAFDARGKHLTILSDDRPQALVKAEMFAKATSDCFERVRVVTVGDWKTSGVTVDRDTVLATFHRARGYIGNGAGKDLTMMGVIAGIARAGARPHGLILFGSPYIEYEFSRTDDEPIAVLKTFSESAASVRAVATLLCSDRT